ncbi:MAG: hypothetical protein WD154_04005 [Nitrosopumilaceae archaeon]
MRKKEPVSIKRQTIYALVPFLDLYAAYKIEKLILYLIIMVGIALASFIFEIVFPIQHIDRITLETFASSYIIIVTQVLTIPLAVYLIRKWSKKWNEKLKTTQP